MAHEVAVVAGASGVVGWRLSQALMNCGKFRVVGCARRLSAPNAWIAGADYAAVDLSDPDACRQFANHVPGVTHLFYTARAEFVTGQNESIGINTEMFRNLLDAVTSGHRRRQISLALPKVISRHSCESIPRFNLNPMTSMRTGFWIFEPVS